MADPADIHHPPPADARFPAATYGTRDLERLTGVSWRTLKRRGTTPPPLPLGRRLRWRRSDIDGWIATMGRPENPDKSVG